MYLALNIICLLFAAVSSVLCVIRTTHMLQLNSYKASVQLKWMRQNFRHYIINILLLIVSVAAAFTKELWLYIVFYVLALIFALANKPMKTQKTSCLYRKGKAHACNRCYSMACRICRSVFRGRRAFWLARNGNFPFTYSAASDYRQYNKCPDRKGYTSVLYQRCKKMLKACPDLKVIGITGSYGKTSVKYYLSTVLKAKYNVLMTPESYNTPMGVVKTIREQLRPTHEVFVCEMGARHVGDIKEICDIVFLNTVL